MPFFASDGHRAHNPGCPYAQRALQPSPSPCVLSVAPLAQQRGFGTAGSSPRSALQGQHQARLELRYEAGVGRQSSHKVRRAGRAAGRAATAQAAVADLCSQMQGSSRQSCHGVRVQRLLESEQVGLPQTLPTSRSSARRTWQPARTQVRGALCPAVHVEQPEVVAMGGEDCCVHLYDVSRAKREPGLLTQLQVRSAKWGSSVALLLAALLPDGKR